MGTALLKVMVWGRNGKQAEEDDKVEEVVVPLPCARARCGWRRAGGRDLKIIVVRDLIAHFTSPESPSQEHYGRHHFDDRLPDPSWRTSKRIL